MNISELTYSVPKQVKLCFRPEDSSVQEIYLISWYSINVRKTKIPRTRAQRLHAVLSSKCQSYPLSQKAQVTPSHYDSNPPIETAEQGRYDATSGIKSIAAPRGHL